MAYKYQPIKDEMFVSDDEGVRGVLEYCHGADPEDFMFVNIL